MIAIVATYYNRLPQLTNTVASLSKYNDFRFIVVDDGSPEPISIQAPFMEVIRLTNKTWYGSCIPYNVGFRKALEYNPDIVIIQNAETYHAGDILGYVRENLTDENYIAFPCYSLSEDDTIPPAVIHNYENRCDGDSAWYNHPVYRPTGYHFCAAITANNLRRINGFDERFKDGCDWDDNYLLHQVRTLGLRIDIPLEPVVYHQWHYSSIRERGTNDNAALYQQLIKGMAYRAVHLLTPDL